jgi:hypothetical protein
VLPPPSQFNRDFHFGLASAVEYTPTSYLLILEVAIFPAAGAFAFAKRGFSCPKMHKLVSLIFSVISFQTPPVLTPSPRIFAANSLRSVLMQTAAEIVPDQLQQTTSLLLKGQYCLA